MPTLDGKVAPIIGASRRTSRHRVAIVGGGFGGLFAAQALREEDVEVTLVDRANHHLFQPLLYQVATGILSEGKIVPPIRDILRRQANATVLLGQVVDIDVGRAGSPWTRSTIARPFRTTA